MELIAAGRDAKVYEYAPGLVLRRYDDGRPADREADVIRDLHPLNVLLAPAGPVVIDWSNARPGPAGLDVALTALIMTQLIVTRDMLGAPAEVEDDLRATLPQFVREFGARVSVAYVPYLPAAEVYRRANPHTTAEERRLLVDAVALAVSLGPR